MEGSVKKPSEDRDGSQPSPGDESSAWTERSTSAEAQGSEGERLLRAATGIAHLIEPSVVALADLNALLASSPAGVSQRFGTVEDFFATLQLRLAEGRLTHVTDRAGQLPPGIQRTEVALTAYLDFTFRHRLVACLCASARLRFSRLADQMQQRNMLVALMISLELSALKCRQPHECARLIQATLSDVANTEMLLTAPDQKLRAQMMTCLHALVSGFSA
jgi:hypothetical protein